MGDWAGQPPPRRQQSRTAAFHAPDNGIFKIPTTLTTLKEGAYLAPSQIRRPVP